MGAFDIPQSGFLCGPEHFVTARLSWGSWFKVRKGFMNAACMLEWARKDTTFHGGQYGDEVWLYD